MLLITEGQLTDINETQNRESAIAKYDGPETGYS